MWSDALAYCEGLVLAGYCDWRLPSRIELQTLVDFTKAEPGPVLDTAVFPGTPGSAFWTSSPVVADSNVAWSVQFDAGDAQAFDMISRTYRARCVRGARDPLPSDLPPARYAIGSGAESGTALDNLTGLRWEQSAGSGTQSAAETFCQGRTTGGYDDWRLPTLNELQTIVDESRINPAIDPDAFPTTPIAYFWTASAYAGDAAYWWGVNFGDGTPIYWQGPGWTYSVRCVR